MSHLEYRIKIQNQSVFDFNFPKSCDHCKGLER
jgi:hypothetical protein